MWMMLNLWVSLQAVQTAQAQDGLSSEDSVESLLAAENLQSDPSAYAPIVLSAGMDFPAAAAAWMATECTEDNVRKLLGGRVNARQISVTLVPQPFAGMFHKKEPRKPLLVVHPQTPYSAYDIDSETDSSQVLCRGKTVIAVTLMPPTVADSEGVSDIASALGPILRCSIQDEFTDVWMHGSQPGGSRVIVVSSMNIFEAVHLLSEDFFHELEAGLATEMRWPRVW